MPNKLRALKQNQLPVRKIAIVGGFLILIVSNVITTWMSVHALNLANASSAAEVLGQQDTSKLSTEDKVKSILNVPDSEKPTVATIVDLAEVQKQNPTFYADAKVGDTVLIYSTKAVIYRPDSGKIINIAPVTKAK
jgi:lipopolysaccharide export LptBFGC system permease protein LptF